MSNPFRSKLEEAFDTWSQENPSKNDSPFDSALWAAQWALREAAKKMDLLSDVAKLNQMAEELS